MIKELLLLKLFMSDPQPSESARRWMMSSELMPPVDPPLYSKRKVSIMKKPGDAKPGLRHVYNILKREHLISPKADRRMSTW